MSPLHTPDDEIFMRRCFELARLGAGQVSPNPQVGAVLVYDGQIIGEGWHQRWGSAHAEINCLQSVRAVHKPLIEFSTLYCNLEPCFHFGKTPPCVDAVLERRIRRVVISNTDPNPLVAGQSVRKMREAGIEVTTDCLAAEGRLLNRAFFTWITQKRPYILLKWAQSADHQLGYIGWPTPISGPAMQRLTHRWRSEYDAILVGATTAFIDDPQLDTRKYYGQSPLRVAIDRYQKLPSGAHLLDDSHPTWILGGARAGEWTNTQFFEFRTDHWIPDLLDLLFQHNKATLMVEGGASVLRQFIELGLWDEIRVIENVHPLGGVGVAAPHVPPDAVRHRQYQVENDRISVYFKR